MRDRVCVIDALRLRDGVTLRVCVTELEGVPEDDDDMDALGVADCDSLGVGDTDDVTDSVGDPEAVPDSLGLWLDVADAVCDVDDNWLCDDEALRVPDVL